jgi:hypothetical protein
MSTSQGSGPAGSLRIGDAERLAAVTALGDHFAAGRLNQDELDERTATAFAARTFADLEPLFADLPAPHPKRPAYAAPAPTGWPPPAESRPGWPPPWDGLARREAGMPSVVPFALAFGILLLLTVVATAVFRFPFLLFPVFWLFVARGGWRARGRGRNYWHHDRWHQDRWHDDRWRQDRWHDDRWRQDRWR